MRKSKIAQQKQYENKNEINEFKKGLLTAFIKHTSASLCINENSDPAAREDIKYYLNKIVPNARGDAAKLVQEATAYKEQVIKQAEGVAQNFVDVYNSYKDTKYVTRQRIYLETLTEVLDGPNKIILDNTGDGQGVVPYLPINELKKNKVNN